MYVGVTLEVDAAVAVGVVEPCSTSAVPVPVISTAVSLACIEEGPSSSVASTGAFGVAALVKVALGRNGVKVAGPW